jgi:glycosyltransferase involved in cell wall biosynthesis
MADALAGVLGAPDVREVMTRAALEHATGLTTEAAASRYLGLLRAMASPRRPEARPIRVAQVLPDLGVGGAERSLATFAAHRHADEVTLFAVVVSGARRPLEETVLAELADHDVPYCDLGVRGRPTRSPAALLVARHRLQVLATRLDLDVLDAALLDAVLPMRLTAGRWRRVTHLVNTPWEPVVRRRTNGRRWRRAVLLRLDRWTARRDDETIAISEAVARSAARHLNHDRVTVIPRGVDLRVHRPAGRLPVAGERPLRVVSIGRLVPQKGHDVLIRAISQARRAGTDVTLSIVGEGPERSRLDALVRDLGLAAVVELQEPVVDVRPRLRDADLFALASRWEGQSNAVLEAMASGLPVLVSDLEVFREVVGAAGHLVPPDDPAAWAEALARLASDADLRSRLGASGRERVVSRYDAAERGAELAGLYRSLGGAVEVGSPFAGWYRAPVAMADRMNEVAVRADAVTAPSYRTTEDGTAEGETPADTDERARVEALLGRPTSARFEVVARGDDGRPLVIRNEPFLDDGTPMPTRYWLVDPELRARIGTIESLGGVRQAEAEVDPAELQQTHDRYAAERDAAIPSGHVGPRPSGGVGGTRRGVKCLHTHYAYLLAGGDDPIGRWVEARLAAADPAVVVDG